MAFRKLIAFLLLLAIHLQPANGQQADRSYLIDVAACNKLLDAARLAMDTSTETAMKIITELKMAVAQLRVDSLTAKVFTEEGYCNFYAGDYRKAALAFDSAGLLWKNINKLNYAKSLNNKGNAMMYNS
ncbi:MAG: hypothetical protein U0T68_12235, partial [Ferruginibacter sp.]